MSDVGKKMERIPMRESTHLAINNIHGSLVRQQRRHDFVVLIVQACIVECTAMLVVHKVGAFIVVQQQSVKGKNFKVE